MKAIILAAGVGQRLGTSAQNRPKCLLEFNGTSLIQRHLKILTYYGIPELILVTGYQPELIMENIASCSGINIRTAHNSRYTEGSLISMQIGLNALEDNDDFLLMDADVLYDHRMIDRLLKTSHRNCFLLDRDFIPGDEPVKLCVKNKQLIEFRKKVNPELQYDIQGESVGFFRFTRSVANQLINAAKVYLDKGEVYQPYEECIRDLLLAEPDNFGFEDITGLNWIEIDFPEDVGRAETSILPNIPGIS